MSEEEEIVRALQPAPDVDFADLFMRDDDAGAQAMAAALVGDLPGVREGRVARAEFFTDRADAERAAGLHD